MKGVRGPKCSSQSEPDPCSPWRCCPPGLATLVLLFCVVNRLVRLPQPPTADVSQIPFVTLFFLLLMASAVAGFRRSIELLPMRWI